MATILTVPSARKTSPPINVSFAPISAKSVAASQIALIAGLTTFFITIKL
jgi:hypothetical protein